jgi:diguanylate cyclase (GGDEF)-like protein
MQSTIRKNDPSLSVSTAGPARRARSHHRGGAMPGGIMDVFIADDSRLVRERLATMLADVDGIRLVGEADDVRTAVDGIRTTQPHTLILDVELPSGTGFDVLEALVGTEPMPRVIMLTNNPHPAYREKCRRAGAEFFFDKTLEFEKVAQVLRVLRGTVAIAPVASNDGEGTATDGPVPEPEIAVLPDPAGSGPAWAAQLVAGTCLLARRLLGVSHAYLRLNAADHPWLPVMGPLPPHESLLYTTLCNQVCEGRQSLVVSDVTSSPRFREGLLACGNGAMRFFAGVPLVLADGGVAGVLNVMDPRPRELSAGQRESLQALAQQVVGNLERARLDFELQQREAQLRLNRPPTRDALTGLQNRAALNESILRSIAHANRHAERLAFFHIDLDDFRRINDDGGRELGDALLVEAGKRLQAAVRGADTVARLGGDEFAVVAQGLHGVEDAEIVAQKLFRALSLPFVREGRRWTTSCSIGVSVFPVDGNDVEALLRHADAAMFRAKCNGQGGYELFAPMPRKAS